jgi:hypothetical protein
LAPFRHRIFLAIWVASLLSNFGGLIQSVGAAWLMTSIGGSADLVALVQASTTLPVMLFSLAAGAIADNFDRRKLMLGAQLFLFCVSVTLALCSYFGIVTPWLLLAFTFLVGCGTAFNGPAWQSLVGEMVPRSDLSSAIALNSMGFNIARSVGPAIGGLIVAAAGAFAAFATNAVSYVGLVVVLARWQLPVPPRILPPESLGSAMAAESLGIADALLISAAALVAGAAIGLRFALPEMTSLNLDPLNSFTEPSVAVDIRPRSGPIVVTIEYRIRARDTVAFLTVMAERKRIRRRDGARHWTLLRDLEQPEIWVERYHTPTWVEYVRHNQRITQADAAVGERIRALHQGPDRPIVRRMLERPTGWLAPGQVPPRDMTDALTDPVRSS